MPWSVEKGHGCSAAKPWAVINQRSGDREGCHATREAALKQQAALYAKEPTMQHNSVVLAFPTEWKAATSGDPGELDGYVSVFGNVDQDGDIVLPGAFKKTLDDWSRSKQSLPLIADHQLSTEGVIGSVVQAKEDGVGLRVRARFSSDAKAQSIRTKMIEGHIKGMSFTYQAVRHYLGSMAGKSVRYLQELKLFEATVTPFPVNQMAVASAKSATAADPDPMDFDQFTDSMRKTLDISYEPARKAAVSALLEAYHPNDTAAGVADEPPTADAAADTGTPAVDTAKDPAAAYALGILPVPPEPRDGALNPITSLEVARTSADLDRVEAEITRALGRATP
jgi:HK97 family phage prohead protease